MDDDIIWIMISHYENVYAIYVCDRSDWVDEVIHDSIKQLVTQSVVIRFGLYLDGGSLKYSDDGLRLMKDYN